MISHPFPKNKSPPLLYSEVHQKLLSRANSSDIEKYVDDAEVRHILGTLFHVKKDSWLIVLRELEGYGLIAVDLRAKKWRVRLI